MQDILATAVEMHQAGRLAPAAQLYQQFLGREQENPDVLHLFGVLNHQQGNHTRAVDLIGRAVALEPNVPAFHANLAEAYRALGQWERAVGCCRTALRLRPDYPEALCNLGLALGGLGRRTETVNCFRRALQLRPDFAAVHSNLGIALRDLHELDEALVHFRRAVELETDSAPARTNLGQILLDLGLTDEALANCQEAVRLQPDAAALHHNLGAALRILGRLVEARAAYLEALRLQPDLAFSHAHLGLILQQEGRLGDALPWLKQAVERAPNDAAFWQYLAELHTERDEQILAVSCWARVLALAPETADVHISLGWALQEEGQLAEAGEHFRAAAELQPGSAPARLNLGGLYEEQGAMAEAEASFREAIRLQPSYALPHARLATLLRGQLPEADVAVLEERLADPRLAPGFRARLLFGLAHVLDARNDFARAADCLRQANALTLDLAHGRRDYAPVEHDAFVNGLLRAFTPDFFTRTYGAGIGYKKARLYLRFAAAQARRWSSRSWPVSLASTALANYGWPANRSTSFPPCWTVPTPQSIAFRILTRALFVGWLAVTSTRWRLWQGRKPTRSWTKCRTITCTSVSSRPCFPAPSSSIVGATCVTSRFHAG